jgi:hypothetical protein
MWIYLHFYVDKLFKNKIIFSCIIMLIDLILITSSER